MGFYSIYVADGAQTTALLLGEALLAIIAERQLGE